MAVHHLGDRRLGGAAAAEGAKAAIVEAAGKIEATFKDQGAADPASEAKPEVWTNWEEFLADAKKLGEAAGAMDVASAESIGAGMGADFLEHDPRHTAGQSGDLSQPSAEA